MVATIKIISVGYWLSRYQIVSTEQLSNLALLLLLVIARKKINYSFKYPYTGKHSTSQHVWVVALIPNQISKATREGGGTQKSTKK